MCFLGVCLYNILDITSWTGETSYPKVSEILSQDLYIPARNKELI